MEILVYLHESIMATRVTPVALVYLLPGIPLSSKVTKRERERERCMAFVSPRATNC